MAGDFRILFWLWINLFHFQQLRIVFNDIHEDGVDVSPQFGIHFLLFDQSLSQLEYIIRLLGMGSDVLRVVYIISHRKSESIPKA
jgi:hypothetical protein